MGYCPDGTPIPLGEPDDSSNKSLSNCDLFSNLTPLDVGFIIGLGGSGGVGPGVTVGIEMVYDLYDFEVDGFVYGGGAAVWGGSVTGYVGFVSGWRYFPADIGVENYTGPFVSFGVGYQLFSGQVFMGPPSTDGGRMAGALLGAGPSGKMEFRGVKLPSIPGSPSLGVPVYKTFGEISQAFGLGSGSSKIAFHQAGTRKDITVADGIAFASYLGQTLSSSPQLAQMMQSIVIYNALAWESQS